jgi:mannose-6-phosphate isomerase-like protein (cupin superfamily)
MPKVSKQTATNGEDFGVADQRSDQLEGYTVEFVTIRETHDLKAMLSVLPGGQCRCPHWGYLLSGRITIDYGDHEETVEAGDAFYMSPGHVPAAEAGTEIVMFSPTDEYAATMTAVHEGMQAAQS